MERCETHAEQRALADLDQAVAAYREVQAADSQLVRVAALANLGKALLARFNRTGVTGDLDEAVAVSRQALAAAPDGHPVQKIIQWQLGAALQTRFDRYRVPDDFDELVETCRWAIASTPSDDAGQAHFALTLGAVLLARYEHLGAESDLDEAIASTVYAISRAAPDHPQWAAAQANFGVMLRIRSQRKGKGLPEDIDSAVNILREIVDRTSDGHSSLPGYLMNLGTALRVRFTQTKSPADLDDAADAYRRAIQAMADDEPDQAGLRSGLANVLTDRFQEFGARDDLDEAVRLHRHALAATPDDHPGRAGMLINLAGALRSHSEDTGIVTDADHVLRVLAEAVRAEASPVLLRMAAAEMSAGLALRGAAAPAKVKPLLETAIRLLPELVPRRLRRSDQQYLLARVAGFADRSAAVLLSDTTMTDTRRAEQALALVEAGRAVLLGQIMETRADLDDLRAAHPQLAARFVDLRDRVDRHTNRTVHTDPEAGQLKHLTELYMGLSTAAGGSDATSRSDPPEQIQLADELAATLRHIRELDGFATFGLPPTTRELLAGAVHGPVVTFTVTNSRCDALILTHDRVTSLRLPGLTARSLDERVTAFHDALVGAAGVDRVGLAAGRDLAPTHHGPDAQLVLTSVLEWLWDTVVGPVLDHLGLHDTPRGHPTTWPRLWWVPGGRLGLLPLHAAGHHRDPDTPRRRTALDRVVSSYTPSVRALRRARRSGVARNRPTRSLIIGMPTTPGLPGDGYLRHVRAEVELLGTLLPGPLTLVSAPDAPTGDAEPPTTRRVLDELPSHEIAHFACHGVQDADPAASRLLLHDHLETPLTVAHLSPVDLDGAQLAYLSACNTALNFDNLLVDEAITLASACQLAGFPHVIGTLWALDDEFAVEVARRFYGALRDAGTGHLDVSRAAYALHETVRSQRDRFPGTPSLWATHLHSGA